MRILLDMDGVMCNLLADWLPYVNDKFGTSLTEGDIWDWDITKSHPDLNDGVYGYFDTPEAFLNLPIMEGARETILKIITDYDHSVYIVTTTATDIGVSNKKKWVRKNLPWFNDEKMIFTSKKHMVNGDILLDDRPSTISKLNALRSAGIHAPLPVRFNQNYNLTTPNKFNVNNWRDFDYQLFKGPLSEFLEKTQTH